MPTPDPSASYTAWQVYAAARDAYVSDLVGAGLDLTRLLIFSVVLAVGVVAFATMGLLVSQVRGR